MGESIEDMRKVIDVEVQSLCDASGADPSWFPRAWLYPWDTEEA